MKPRGGRPLSATASSRQTELQARVVSTKRVPGRSASAGAWQRREAKPSSSYSASESPLSPVAVAPRPPALPSSPAQDEEELLREPGVFCRRVVDARDEKDSVLLIRRAPEVKLMNPERFSLDRKRLTSCPILDGEERLKLLNLQNNFITEISNLHNLPSLVFLDLYNNSIHHISGLECVPSLRVLMLGKNCLTSIEGLESLTRLDVLDLHNNNITKIASLSHLTELRVLNLAGNQLQEVSNLAGLKSLTEINLRRNMIQRVSDLDQLHNLQRVFLSNNDIRSISSMECLFKMRTLTELSLDGNPVASDSAMYRQTVVEKSRTLRHLDMRRVTEEERRQAAAFAKKEEERQAARLKLEAALTERMQAIEYIHQSWEDEKAQVDAGVCMLPDVALQPDARRTAQPRDKKKGFIEIDMEKGEVQVFGTGADWVLPDKVDQSTLVSVHFQYTTFARVVTRFLPHLASLPNLSSLKLSNNRLTSMSQIAQLSRLSGLEQLEIRDNEILASADLRRYCCVSLPHLRILNGQPLSGEERNEAASKYGGFTRLLQCSRRALMYHRHVVTKSLKRSGGALPEPHPCPRTPPNPYTVLDTMVGMNGVPNEAAKVAAAYVDSVMVHATAIDAKIQLLNKQWDQIVHQIILAVVSEAEEVDTPADF